MKQLSAPPSTWRWRARASNTSLPVRVGVIVAALAALVVVYAVVTGGGSSSRAMPTSPAIEARWGIRVTQIGATADGGLVDFRFVVLDVDKAADMMADVKNMPVLIAEDSNTAVTSTAQMGDDHSLHVGQTYFLLYRNAGGAIQPGTSVTVKFGTLELQHVIAK